MYTWIFPSIELGDMTKTKAMLKLSDDVVAFIASVDDYEVTENKRDKLALLETAMEVMHSVETVLHYYNITHKELCDARDMVQTMKSLSGVYKEDTRSNAEKNNAQNGVTWSR